MRAPFADGGREWLETDGLGGFASGTPSGLRTRRYHGLLCVAAAPPVGRRMLLAGVEVWIDAGSGPVALSSQRWASGAVAPDGASRLAAFSADPLPARTFALGGGLELEERFFLRRGTPVGALIWRLRASAGVEPPRGARLWVRPLCAARDAHALEREDAGFRLEVERRPLGAEELLRLAPRAGEPALLLRASGRFLAEPCWYRGSLLEEERARGYDHVEDLAAPGVFELDLADGAAALVFGAELPGERLACPAGVTALELALDLEAQELERRAAFATPLERAADHYVVRRGAGATIVAGYPWFADWGRDTFIALRGLLLATGRLDEAGSVLLRWAAEVDGGMLPNRFPDVGAAGVGAGGEAARPEYNSVDAALWFCVAAGEYADERARAGRPLPRGERRALREAVGAIVEGCQRGTRHGIRVDADGLLRAGAPGVQLTWMDALVDGRVITPRHGKPVEVQALWINALAAAERLDGPDAAGPAAERRRRLLAQAERSFAVRFWNDATGCLYDVVDEGGAAGADDARLRPNQILAVGGLPRALLAGPRARSVVDAVERELWTPLGLRTLAPSDARYRGTYAGDVTQRDEAYHMGTAWPWLLGPFVEAWIAVRGGTREAALEAERRFVEPLRAHLSAAGLGHVSEIADGDAPWTPRGCPFQAWSVGELLRLERRVLPAATAAPKRPREVRT